MKKLLLLLLISLPVFAAAQLPKDFPMPLKDDKILYEIVQDSIKLSKNKLFAASKKWLTDNFVSSKAVIQSEDIETGQIIGQGFVKADNFWNSTALFGVSLDLHFTIQIDCREGRYRFRIYDINNVTNGAYIGEVRKPLEVLAQESMRDKQRIKLYDAIKDADNKFITLIYGYNKALSGAESDDF